MWIDSTHTRYMKIFINKEVVIGTQDFKIGVKI
jgi:hypothetical protein